MNVVLALERLGYRFQLDGDKVTARHYGAPPADAESLLLQVTQEDVRRVLEDRKRGFVDVHPEELAVPLEKATACIGAIQAAIDSGQLLAWEIVPEFRGGVVIFLLTPPGSFDVKPWEV